LNRKERKDHKEETSQALLFEFFVFFAVKTFLELRDFLLLHHNVRKEHFK
jgi:hypothetical protein